MFEIVGAVLNVTTIAVGRGIRELKRLEKAYGKGRWRKKKGGALRLGMLRVVDESGDDFLYPAERFASLTLSPRLARAFAK